MLNVNPEIVCGLVAKAQQFHAQDGVVLSEDSGPGEPEDWEAEALAEHQDDPLLLDFKAMVDDLEPDQQVAVVALMWVGRGDFDAQEWEDAYNEAADEWTSRTAEYLISTPLVADYLIEGLEQLGYSCD